MSDQQNPGEAATNGQRLEWADAEELLPGDTYEDGPYIVFTAQYHLRRGYCCNSGCRHCPYK